MEPTIIRELEPRPESGHSQDLPPNEDAKDSGEFTPEQDSKIRIITNNLHRLNDSIVQAVTAGLSVEILRASRYHGGIGNWGDQIYLALKKTPDRDSA